MGQYVGLKALLRTLPPGVVAVGGIIIGLLFAIGGIIALVRGKLEKNDGTQHHPAMARLIGAACVAGGLYFLYISIMYLFIGGA